MWAEKRKGFDVAVIDDRRILALQSRLTGQQVVDLLMENRPAVVAIGSPCCCAPRGLRQVAAGRAVEDWRAFGLPQ